MLYTDNLLFIFISTTHIIKFSIYLCLRFFFVFWATFRFTNPDYRLILTTSPLINMD
jgi:hypothetical protein